MDDSMYPVDAIRPLARAPRTPICACYDGWVFLGVQIEDADETIEVVPCRRCQ
jgi:hypothetical protein